MEEPLSLWNAAFKTIFTSQYNGSVERHWCGGSPGPNPNSGSDGAFDLGQDRIEGDRLHHSVFNWFIKALGQGSETLTPTLAEAVLLLTFLHIGIPYGISFDRKVFTAYI